LPECAVFVDESPQEVLLVLGPLALVIIRVEPTPAKVVAGLNRPVG